MIRFQLTTIWKQLKLQVTIFNTNYLQMVILFRVINNNNYLVHIAQSAMGCRIHRLALEEQDPTNECPGYDIKHFDGEVPVMLQL